MLNDISFIRLRAISREAHLNLALTEAMKIVYIYSPYTLAVKIKGKLGPRSLGENKNLHVL